MILLLNDYPPLLPVTSHVSMVPIGGFIYPSAIIIEYDRIMILQSINNRHYCYTYYFIIFYLGQ